MALIYQKNNGALPPLFTFHSLVLMLHYNTEIGKGGVMATFFRVMGRLAGRALRSHAMDSVVTKVSGYVLSEMRLADIKLKLRLLRQKRTHHISLLGKTVYRLFTNDIDPFNDSHTRTISNVLREIDMEITAMEEELERRAEFEQNRHKAENRTK